jgi:ribosomal protein S18 acetylase RimI-like enzyme
MLTTTTLRDGRAVSIRPLQTEDRPLVARILEAMSAEARYRRFLSPMPRIRSKVVDYLANIDGVNHLAAIALHGPEPAGMARVVVAGDQAELAVEISDPFAGVGLGRHLTETVLAMAADRGLVQVDLTVFPDNMAARRLFRNLGAALHFADGLLVGSMPTRLSRPAA